LKYTLFVGNRIGYEALSVLINKNVNIQSVFIEKEHSHENEKYFDKIIEICQSRDISYSLKLNSEFIYESLIKDVPDIIMSFGYRRFIPSKIYKLAQICSVGSHFAPLPKYRGFAPVNWAIINGEKETAVTLFHLGDGIDDGDIISQKIIPISNDDDINDVLEQCIVQFKLILSEEVKNFNEGIIKRIPQNHQDATYTCSRTPEDGYIDWNKSTREIYNLIRAITYPFPGAYSYLNDEKLIIWKAKPIDLGTYIGRIPGRIVKIIKEEGVCVLTGDGALLITDVQYGDSGILTADKIIKSVRLRLK
jgi:methionyl-tRNA formyltransferase